MGKQDQKARVTFPRSPRCIFCSSSLCTPQATTIYPATLSFERWLDVCVWVRYVCVCVGGVSGGRG